MTEETTYNYEELSTKQLKQIAKERNSALGLKQGDPGYIATGNKGAMIAQELRLAEEITASPARNDVDVRNLEMPISQIQVHEGNYRDEKDYHDPQLVDAYVRNGGKFFGTIVVTEGSKGKYRVVSGNRSFSCYLVALDKLGIDHATVSIPVQERIYGGNAQQQAISEVTDMALANELQRPMSVIDKLHWYQDLTKLGLPQEAIARLQYGEANATHKNSLISIVMGYARLPQSFQAAMHNQFHRNVYAANGEQWLKDNNVPYVQDGDDINVLGLTTANADVITKLYPRRNSPGEQEGVDRVNDFLLADPEILTASFSMTASSFKTYLEQKAVEAGIKEGKKETVVPVNAGTTVHAAETEQETEQEASSEDTGKQPAKKEKSQKAAESASRQGPHLDSKVTTVQAAYELGVGELVLASDTLEKLRAALDKDVPGALDTYKFLMFHDMLIDDI